MENSYAMLLACVIEISLVTASHNAAARATFHTVDVVCSKISSPGKFWGWKVFPRTHLELAGHPFPPLLVYPIWQIVTFAREVDTFLLAGGDTFNFLENEKKRPVSPLQSLPHIGKRPISRSSSSCHSRIVVLLTGTKTVQTTLFKDKLRCRFCKHVRGALGCPSGLDCVDRGVSVCGL